MKKHWWALFVALVMYAPVTAAAQSTPGGGGSGSTAPELGQNYPNPVTTDTKIPFSIAGGAGGGGCQDPSQLHKVSLKIYNILSQFVAVPVLQSGGTPVENLMLTCDQYNAYWDAKYSKTGQRVPAGIYLYRLEVDGRVITKKLIVSK